MIEDGILDGGTPHRSGVTSIYRLEWYIYKEPKIMMFSWEEESVSWEESLSWEEESLSWEDRLHLEEVEELKQQLDDPDALRKRLKKLEYDREDEYIKYLGPSKYPSISKTCKCGRTIHPSQETCGDCSTFAKGPSAKKLKKRLNKARGHYITLLVSESCKQCQFREEYQDEDSYGVSYRCTIWMKWVNNVPLEECLKAGEALLKQDQDASEGLE